MLGEGVGQCLQPFPIMEIGSPDYCLDSRWGGVPTAHKLNVASGFPLGVVCPAEPTRPSSCAGVFVDLQVMSGYAAW